jgi:UDP-N-acetylglucosamine 2-epimerase
VEGQKLFVYPCTDSDYQGIIAAIEEERGSPDVQIHPNIECSDFWGLQNVASVFVGNSSAGVIEAPTFALPYVLVGGRQQGRERAGNCIEVPEDEEQIHRAIETSLRDQAFRESLRTIASPYGKGEAYLKISEVLTTVELGRTLFSKRMTY